MSLLPLGPCAAAIPDTRVTGHLIRGHQMPARIMAVFVIAITVLFGTMAPSFAQSDRLIEFSSHTNDHGHALHDTATPHLEADRHFDRTATLAAFQKDGERRKAKRGERRRSDGRRDRPVRQKRPYERPRGDRRRDDRPRGDRPGRDRPRGDAPRRDRPSGDRPGRDRPRGDRPRNDRPRGDGPRNDRPRGDRPRRDRRDDNADRRRDDRSDRYRRRDQRPAYRRDRYRDSGYRDRRYRSDFYRRPGYAGRRYAHGYRRRSGHGYFCLEHGLFHYFIGFDPFGFTRVAHYGRSGFRYSRDCFPVEKVDYWRGRKALIGGIMCYDSYGYPYIMRRSRYVKRYLY